MIIEAARRSLLNLFAPETRAVFWKVLGLTILVLVGLWLALRQTFAAVIWPWFAIYLPDVPDWAGWLTLIAAILAGDGWAPETPDVADDDLPARVASLTPSQLRILEGLKAGRLNKQIAFDLGVSEATIKAHLTSVFRKLGVHNRTQAVILAKQMDPS